MTVWINEFHYDNASTDVGEFIELAGLAGTSLFGWSIVLYNGSNGTAYNTVSLDSLTFSDESNGYGTDIIEFPSNGLQNGSPDGIALVDDNGAVVEFISYEGSLTAVDGPAAGLTSTDIGVEESFSTPIGFSLQRTGNGTSAGDFTWAAAATETRDTINTGQTFGTAAAGSVWINEFHYDNASTDVGEFIELAGNAGIDLTGWSLVLYNGSNGSVYNTVALSGVLADQSNGFGTSVVTFPSNGLQNGSPDGIALVDDTGSVVEFISYEGSFTAVGGPADGLTSTDIGVAESSSTPAGFSLQLTGTGTESSDFTWAAASAETPNDTNTGQTFGDGSGGGGGGGGTGTPTGNVFINEFHYDNDGADTGEFIELAGEAGIDLTGWSLVLYNGNGGAAYNTVPLSGLLTDESDGFGFAVFEIAGIQNGSPDGIALVDGNGDVIEFLSYEGTLTAVDGPAAGLTSTDVGVAETGSTEVGFSLQRTGTGDEAADFTFAEASAETKGEVNTGQSFGDVIPPVDFVAIYDIQGKAHTSPFLGQEVRTTGIVTAVDSNGFYVQDATGDGDFETSDALFVFTSSSPGVSVGDAVEVTGFVSEFFPGGASTGNLSTTQIANPSSVTVQSSGNALPDAVIIGTDGRLLPTQNIDDDAFAEYDPTNDGIDFWESLEGMYVTATDLVAVAATNNFGEIFAVTDPDSFDTSPTYDLVQGRIELLEARAHLIPAIASYIEQLEAFAETLAPVGLTTLSDRGTLNISPDDFNPEKIQIDEDSGVFDFDFPTVNVGAELGDVTGVISYSFGNFEIIPTQEMSVTASDLQQEVTDISGGLNELSFASYNVLNLDPNDSDGDTDVADGRFASIATDITVNMGSPYIIALQEVQDSSGSANDGVVSASDTLDLLTQEIYEQSGIQYEWIDNTFIGDLTSGGQPGGNIRTAYLYNPAYVTLDEESVDTISGQGTGEAFEGARLPLVAAFEFAGETFTFVNVHFSSKGGSAPIMGVQQDFAARQEDVTVNGSLDERQLQATAVADYVAELDNVVVLGDFNEFEFVSPVAIIEDAGLTNLTNTLDEDERYSFIFQGNSQSLDHILISDALAADATFDVVHLNSEFASTDDRSSDHDPLVASLLVDEFLIG